MQATPTIYDTDDDRSSAFVESVINGDNQTESKRVGFAMYAKNRENYSHEFHISVDQTLKQTTLPAQLLSVIVQHAKQHGVKVLFRHSDENNQETQALAKRTGMLITLESGQSHGIKYTLMLDKHPDIMRKADTQLYVLERFSALNCTPIQSALSMI